MRQVKRDGVYSLYMAKRLNQDIKRRTSRSHKTKKRLEAKKVVIAARDAKHSRKHK